VHFTTRRRAGLVAVFAAALVAMTGSTGWAIGPDWPQFGYDAAHSSLNPTETALNRNTVGGLTRVFTASLPGVADAPVVYRPDVSTSSGVRDLIFAHTRDGWTTALDASSGKLIWSRQVGPGTCRINNGPTPCYTTSSAALDPSGGYVYSYGLDGNVHKYMAGTGVEIRSVVWPELATRKPFDEKGSSDLALVTSHGTSYLFVANGGYPGDRGDYQGHVTAINLGTGIQRVFNTACSDQTVHFASRQTPDCSHLQSAVWARGGVTYDAALDRVYLTTGNGDFDVSGHNWGDTVLALHADGTGSGGNPLDTYTPANFQDLQDRDADLGSSAPALMQAPAGSSVVQVGVQAGKDAKLRLLNVANLSGRSGIGHTGGELQILDVPQGGQVLTQPATWTDSSGTGWLFLANGSGISGLRLTLQGNTPKLTPAWKSATGGTTPVLANGVLYYLTGSGVRALDPATGATLWAEPTSSVGLHWQSAIVVAGHLYYPDGSGKLRAYALPSHAGAIVGIASECLDDSHSGTADGNRIQLYHCNGTAAQRWTLPGDGTIRVLGKCLDDNHSDAADGTKIQLYHCNKTAAQRWSLPGDGTIRVFGRCLDDAHSGTADGNRIQLWHCNGTGAQRWRTPSQ
jgi:hypothetical protein